MKRAIWMLAALALLLGGSGQAKAGFVNGSFETGDFTGWITHDIAAPFKSLAVHQAGYSPGSGLFTTAPTDGKYAATTGFDGTGPGHITLAQEILVGPGTSKVTFDYRAGWNLQDYSWSTLPRTFDVEILSSGGGSVLLDQNLITADAGTKNLDTGSLHGSVDVSRFAGQTVRVQFDWYVPETHTGPAFAQLDNVQLENTPLIHAPAPPGLVLVGTSLFPALCYFGWRRRKQSVFA